MKKIIFINLIVLLAIAANGQTIVSGKFKSLPKTEFRLVQDQLLYNDYRGTILAQDTTNNNGEFSVSFNLTFEKQIVFYIDQHFFRLWIVPGERLVIDENDEGYAFSGKAAAENVFLYRAGIMQPYKNAIHIISAAFDGAGETKYYDSLENERWKLYNTLFVQKKPSIKFYTYCKGEITYFSYFSKSQYPNTYIYLKKNLKQADIPTEYYSFWKKMEFQDDSCASDNYQNCVRDYIYFLTTVKAATTIYDENFYAKSFTIMDSLLAHKPLTLKKQKAVAIDFLIKYYDFPLLATNKVSEFAQAYPGSPYTDFINKEWNKKNAEKMALITFTLLDTSGKSIAVSDFKGKIVYIDFWGSWCKPCMEQMAHSATLQQKFKGKDIVFLFINFYDSQQKWITTIKKNQLNGVHVKAEVKDEKYFEDIFGVKNGFPRYAVLDKNGRLITTAAPHPNSDRATVFLDELLK